jgi:hypothetical protein
MQKKVWKELGDVVSAIVPETKAIWNLEMIEPVTSATAE